MIVCTPGRQFGRMPTTITTNGYPNQCPFLVIQLMSSLLARPFFFYRLFFRYSAGLPLRHDMSTGNSLIATTRQEAVDNEDGSDFFIDVSDHLTTGSRTINAQHECCTFTRYHFLTRAYCF